VIRVLEGDCRTVMAGMEADSFDSCVTDPPYGLGFMGKQWDTFKAGDSPMRRSAEMDAVNAGMSRQGGRQRACADYAKRQARDMQQFQAWCTDWAVEAYRVLKPGAFLLAFGGTRTYHRLVCAIEDAGFEVRDMIAWLYGSGFPKGTDKAKIPAEWQGWNTALKPAIEPICLARKPMVGTLAENLKRYGTGALFVDGCRVAMSADDAEAIESMTGFGRAGYVRPKTAETFMQGTPDAAPAIAHALGRWPANVIHDGSEEVIAAFPQASGAVAPVTGHEPTGHGFSGNVYGAPGTQGRQPSDRRDGGGSAARFFWSPKASRADRNDGLQGMAEQVVSVWGGDEDDLTAGKKSTKPRANHHPTVKPTDLMRYLCKLVTQPGGRVLDPFMGSGSTLKAAELEGFEATGIELNPAYIEIARRRIASDAPLFAEVA
jgi:DNA modification methylase